MAAAFHGARERRPHELERALIGLDNLARNTRIARSDATGYTSAKKIADHWVPTTCGYCSVGCGIEIGVKDGRAVACAAACVASG